MSQTLAVTTVPAYLRERGLSSVPDAGWKVEGLTGGVSGAVYAASDGARDFVVKQSLDKLAVEDDWTAPRERILNEARVLGIIGDIVPTRSPTVLDVDAETLTLTMERAPTDWSDWKSELLAGGVDSSLAGSLGTTLGTIHARTRDSAWSLPPDDGAAGFAGLRIEPFHHTVAERLPQLAGRVLTVAERVLAEGQCLVHGDFSPKNILVAPSGGGERAFWIIDDEVGHRGDPAFDLAFFLSHLALKRIRAGSPTAAEFDRAAAAFIRGYAETGLPIRAADLSEQIGCLVLARVVGRSPVRYLDRPQQDRALGIGEALLIRPDEFDIDHPLEIA